MLPNLVLYEEEFNLVTDVIKRLVSSANAKVVFLVDKNGQLITSSGHTEGIDTTSQQSDSCSMLLQPTRCDPGIDQRAVAAV